MKLPYAEEINYRKTSKVDADTWIDKTKDLIAGFGGKVLGDAFGSDSTTGQAAYMISFSVNEDKFKIVWPVLPSRDDNVSAARRQAATFLYHDTKAKCLKALLWGPRTAFFEYLMLPDGRQASQLSAPEIMAHIPNILQITRKGG